jgi:DNA-binding transcriptional ArsR family regulator
MPRPEPERRPQARAREIADPPERRDARVRKSAPPRLIPPPPSVQIPIPKIPRIPPIPPLPKLPGFAPPPVPDGAHQLVVKDLATLRVLTDPLRLAILGAFGDGGRERPMTVKEIAERIDEGPTKLYRHIKQLEDAGLLAVVGTRLVSGILEKSYRPVYRRIDVDSDLLNLPGQQDEYWGAISALLESARMRLLNELRAGNVPLEKPEQGPDLSLEVNSIGAHLRPEQYDQVHTKLNELMELLMSLGSGQEDDPEAFPVRFQVLMYPLPDRAGEASAAEDKDEGAAEAEDGSS